MKKFVKKMALTLAIVSLVSAFAGLPVSASNHKDTSWSFYITDTSNGKTKTRPKNNTTSVYVNVTEVPYIYIKARTLGVDNLGKEHNDTIGSEVTLKEGKYLIKNLIYERGRRIAMLNIYKFSVTGAYARGQWSPDSVGSYPIANN